MDRIIISGMQFYGRHGLRRHETEDGQVFGVDVEIGLDLEPAAKADSVKLTVDYGDVFNRVREVVEGPPVKMIEALAEQIAARLLDRFERVETVTVRVHKPRAPIPGTFADACVEIRRARSG